MSRSGGRALYIVPPPFSQSLPAFPSSFTSHLELLLPRKLLLHDRHEQGAGQGLVHARHVRVRQEEEALGGRRRLSQSALKGVVRIDMLLSHPIPSPPTRKQHDASVWFLSTRPSLPSIHPSIL